MAGQQGMPNYWNEVPGEAGVALPGRRRRDDERQRQILLDAGRVFMLWGWSALPAFVSAPPASKEDALHAFLGLVLWLLGVSLVALEPTAFPRAAGLGAAAANVVLGVLLFLRP